jgi:hypothetical protein
MVEYGTVNEIRLDAGWVGGHRDSLFWRKLVPIANTYS